MIFTRFGLIVVAGMVALALSLLFRVLSGVWPEMFAPPDDVILAGFMLANVIIGVVWMVGWSAWCRLRRFP